MSKDFALSRKCPHFCHRLVDLEQDRRTLTLPDLRAVRLHLTDETGTELLSTGTYAEALLVSAPGPFLSAAKVVYRSLSEGTVKTIKAPFGKALLTAQGRVVLTDPEGLEILSTQGGVTFDRTRASKRQIYPPWTETEGLVTFAAPLLAVTTVEVRGQAPLRRCPRCQGTGIENDLQVTSTGDLQDVTGTEKLQQSVLKALMTIKGSNPYHPWYGTNLKGLIGSKMASLLVTQVTSEVQTALAALQRAQNEQSRYQTLSPAERLYAVQGVTVTPIDGSSTRYRVAVTVKSAANSTISLGLVYAT